MELNNAQEPQRAMPRAPRLVADALLLKLRPGRLLEGCSALCVASWGLLSLPERCHPRSPARSLTIVVIWLKGGRAAKVVLQQRGRSRCRSRGQAPFWLAVRASAWCEQAVYLQKSL